MFPLSFRDADGALCWLAGLDQPPAGMRVLDDRSAAAVLRGLDEHDLKRLWCLVADDQGDEMAPERARRWALAQASGPAARLRIWRALGAPRCGGERIARAPIVDLADLAPRPAPEHWVELRVVDADGEPLSSVPLTLVRGDGARVPARTDANGIARWRQVPSGPARVIFDEDEPSYVEDR